MINRRGGCLVETTINGKAITFFVANQNDMIQSHHYHGQFYEAEEIAIIAKFFPGHGAFVDVGANVGNHAVYACKFLEPRTVIVFEPNPEAIAILRANLALNHCHAVDTRFLGVALGVGPARLKLEERDMNNLGSARFVPSEEGTVNSIAGDLVLLQEAPSFIKVDIEGMEMEVLAGLSQTIQQWRPNIFIEIQNYNSEEFHRWCSEMRYSIVEKYQRYEDIINLMVVPMS